MCMHMYMCMLGECVTGFLTEREASPLLWTQTDKLCCKPHV